MTARYLTSARLRELAQSLGERDSIVLRELARLRFVSGSQLARLCFADADGTADHRAAKRVLLRLTRLGVLARLPRPVGGIGGGSGGFVYYLDAAGQRLSMKRGWLPEGRHRRPSVPGRLFVGHALDVAELHTRLAEAARTGHFKLRNLQAEPSCWRDTGGATLKPDTFIRLVLGDYEDSYFIEVDRGTEGSGAVQRQLEHYLSYHRSGREQAAHGVFPKVLWLAADAERVRIIADLIARQPGPADELFAVAEFDTALILIAKGEATDNALQNTL
jgi:Replication-relaxation